MNLFIHSIPLWAELLSLAFCIGTLVCRSLVFSPVLIDVIPDRDNLLRRMWILFGIAVAVMLAGSVVDFLARTSEMSGRPIHAVFPLIPAVIQKTHFGRVWIIRIAALILVSVMTVIGRHFSNSGFPPYVLLSLAALIAWTHSATGHAADRGDFTIAEITDWLHLLGASVWGGGLFALSTVFLPFLEKRGVRVAKALAGLAAGFSRTAGVAVGVIALTSLHHAWAYVGGMEALEETPYGKIVLAKIVLFLLLLVLAAFNKYFMVPFLYAKAGFPAPRHGIAVGFLMSVTTLFERRLQNRLTASWFQRIVKTEAFLMLAVFFCVSLLRHEIPASHYLHHDHAGHLNGVPAPVSGPIVSLETVPAEIEAGMPVKIMVRIEDKTGRPLVGLVKRHERILHAVIVGQDLKTFAYIHPEDFGPVTDEMVGKASFPLRYAFQKSGDYLVGLDFATRDKLYSETVLLQVVGGPALREADIDLSRAKDFGPYHVTLASTPPRIKAGEQTILSWHIERKGKPVTNLQPYLGAAMHVSAVSANLQHFIYTHGVLQGEPHAPDDYDHAVPPGRFGPDIESPVLFPVGGIYAIFGQVKHEGRVLLFSFMVDVR